MQSHNSASRCSTAAKAMANYRCRATGLERRPSTRPLLDLVPIVVRGSTCMAASCTSRSGTSASSAAALETGELIGGSGTPRGEISPPTVRMRLPAGYRAARLGSQNEMAHLAVTSKQRPAAGRGAKGWQATQGNLSATGAGWPRIGPAARRANVEDKKYCPGALKDPHRRGRDGPASRPGGTAAGGHRHR